MQRLGKVLVVGLTIGILGGAAAPALALGGKQLKGVLERVDGAGADRHVVVHETGGKKGRVPLSVAKDAEISTPSGRASFDALHVGDEVTVRYHTGKEGEEATAIQVTKAASGQ